MRVPVLLPAICLLLGSTAWAQTKPAPPTVPASAQPNGRGFTALVNGGVGIQHDAGFGATATGLAGPNGGAGWFLTPRLAALFRVSGTTAKYSDLDDLKQVSGVVGGTAQYWLTDRIAVEGGAGVGYWSIGGVSDQDLGLVLGASAVIFRRGSHHVLAGGEYAPVFTEGGTVHNAGITVGYQFRRSR